MFASFFKKNYQSDCKDMVQTEEDEHKPESSIDDIASGLAAGESARISAQQAAKKFAKPSKYDRKLFDSGKAKVNAKKLAFKDGKTVIDPYTGQELVLTKAEAKLLYGSDWTKHLAESDHIKSLKSLFSEQKDNVWVTTGDIGDAANNHIVVTSRKFNNGKREKSNSEYVNDEEYLERTGVELTKSGKKKAIADEKRAEAEIKQELNAAARRNIASTFHEAGVQGAKSAGATAATITGIMNIVDVLNGEKDADEAIADTVIAGGKAAVSGYITSGGLVTACQSLSNSKSEFIKALMKSNVPANIITAITVTGDTLTKYFSGEISTQECMIELGSKGLNMATAGYSMLVGQALIPIPIIGGAIGAFVGSLMTGKLYEDFINQLQIKELEHQERMRIIEECNRAAEQARIYRIQLENYLQNYFNEYQTCFDESLSCIRFSFQAGDADGIIAGANRITRKLGGQVKYENMEEFEVFLKDDSPDIL